MAKYTQNHVQIEMENGDTYEHFIKLPNGKDGVATKGRPGDRGEPGPPGSKGIEETVTTLETNYPATSKTKNYANVFDNQTINFARAAIIEESSSVANPSFATPFTNFIACDSEGNILPMAVSNTIPEAIGAELVTLIYVLWGARRWGSGAQTGSYFLDLTTIPPRVVMLTYQSDESGLKGFVPFSPSSGINPQFIFRCRKQDFRD